VAGAVGQNTAGVAEDCGQYVTVGGQSECVVDAEGAAVVGGGSPGAAFEVGQADRDDQLAR